MKLVNFMKKTSNDMVPEVIQVPYCAKVALGREKRPKTQFCVAQLFLFMHNSSQYGGKVLLD